MHWTSLQKKIFVLVVSLFSLVYLLTLSSVYTAAYNQAEREFANRLAVGRNVFQNQMTVAKTHFDASVETVAKDWALRSAVGKDSDPASVASVLGNHAARIRADIAMVLDDEFNEKVRYDVRRAEHFPLSHSDTIQIKGLKPWVSLIGGDVYLMSAEPLRAPTPIGWLVMGRRLNDGFLARIKRLITVDISLVVTTPKLTLLSMSTVEEVQEAQTLPAYLTDVINAPLGSPHMIHTGTEDALTLPFVVFSNQDTRFLIVLEDDFSRSITSLQTFMLELLPFFIGGVLVTLFGSYLIARSISRPVSRLLEAAKRVAGGQYTEQIHVSERSELRELANEFYHMQEAVMSRESKIREQAEQIKEANQQQYEVTLARKEKQLAEEATKAKSRFLANVSHEIRTPLNALVGYSEMLQDKEVTHSDRQQATNAIYTGSKHLLNIVSDVLDVSKIEANKIDLEWIETPLLALLDEVAANVEGLARQKSLRFDLTYDFPLPAFINTDPTRLKQILLNLCNNAIKFTERGMVELNVGMLSERGLLNFTISDTGVGMTQEQQKNLFVAFSQADQSTSRKFGGSGLGLFICKQLVDLFGGHIEVFSQTGKGSRFTVEIPCQLDDSSDMLNEAPERQEQQDTPGVIEDVPQFDAHILCADDNEDNRALLSYLLGKTGANVTQVTNGREAVEAGIRGNYDLLLMDMQMPIMDGLRATKLLKEAEVNYPIVMLTANVDQDSRQQCNDAGADGHISKPIDARTFYRCLREYLSTSPEVRSQPEPEDAQMQLLKANFRKGLAGRRNVLLQAISDQAWQDVESELHKLKGAAGSFGFQALGEQAAKIEQRLKQAPSEALERELDKLLDDMQQSQEDNTVARHQV